MRSGMASRASGAPNRIVISRCAAGYIVGPVGSGVLSAGSWLRESLGGGFLRRLAWSSGVSLWGFGPWERSGLSCGFTIPLTAGGGGGACLSRLIECTCLPIVCICFCMLSCLALITACRLATCVSRAVWNCAACVLACVSNAAWSWEACASMVFWRWAFWFS